MGRATDLARIQFRMLNRSKGPAVWSPRAQCDRGLYRRAVRGCSSGNPDLESAQGTVARLLASSTAKRMVSRRLDGRLIPAPAVVLTAGTFLRGRIHLGLEMQIRPAEPARARLLEYCASHLNSWGYVRRFKTGTPPRIDGRRWISALVAGRRLGAVLVFSFYERPATPGATTLLPHLHTEELREIVERTLKQSALYGGAISGAAPATAHRSKTRS